MTYRLLKFYQDSGQLSVQFGEAAPVLIDVPVEDGKYLSGDMLHSYIRGFEPVWNTARAQEVLSASGADTVHSMCESPSMFEAPTPSYAQLRAGAYPPITDYLDAVVKGDQSAIDAYIDRCIAVKALFPKPEVSQDVLKARLGT